ncbi:reverse transcriptase [Tanacetum coccineum]
MCQQAPLQFSITCFPVNLLLLPIYGADLVLGVEWLAGLGPVLFDYKELWMEFAHESSNIRLLDASGTGVGAVLTQNGHPIAYFSKEMSLRLQSSSTYVLEMYAITETIRKWRIQTLEQQKWITKLLGYDFDIVCKPGSDNGPIDSLSRLPSATLQAMRLLSQPILALWDALRELYKSNPSGKTVIFVVVDRLSKHAHFSALGTHFTSPQVAQVFIKDIVRLHGIPSSIVSDRDLVFVSSFWRELIHQQGTKLAMSRSSSVASVEDMLQQRSAILLKLKENLLRAQNRMRNQAILKRIDVSFVVGNWVFLKLQPYRQSSLAHRQSHKLAKRFYGPFPIKERIGPVAYHLELPSTAKIHDVFHASLVPQVLVQWENQPTTNATWEPLNEFCHDFPDFDLEGKVPSYREVIVNGDAPAVASASVEGPIPPKTAEQKMARKNELKAKSTLLLAIPDEHLLKSGLEATKN